MTDRKPTDRRLSDSPCGRPRMQSGCTCGHRTPTRTDFCRADRPAPHRSGPTCPPIPPAPESYPSAPPTCKNAKEELRKVEFAITETALYLDAHPDSDCALAFYRKLVEERADLRRRIACECGPMTIYENACDTSWKWVEGPWPWHPDAN